MELAALEGLPSSTAPSGVAALAADVENLSAADVEDVTLTFDVGGDELTRHALAGGEGRSETIGADSLVLSGLGSARQPLASAALAPRVGSVATEAHADASVTDAALSKFELDGGLPSVTASALQSERADASAALACAPCESAA